MYFVHKKPGEPVLDIVGVEKLQKFIGIDLKQRTASLKESLPSARSTR